MNQYLNEIQIFLEFVCLLFQRDIIETFKKSLFKSKTFFFKDLCRSSQVQMSNTNLSITYIVCSKPLQERQEAPHRFTTI